MKLTIHDQKLLAHCCEELIHYLKGYVNDNNDKIEGKESILKKYVSHMNVGPLSRDEAIDALQAALRIEQIYYRVIHILNYINKHPHEFMGEYAPWVEEAHRMKEIYLAAEHNYLGKLSAHSIEILQAYNVTHETPKTFAADAKIKEKIEPAKTKALAQSSIVSTTTALEHKQFKIKTLIGILKDAVKKNGDELGGSPPLNSELKTSGRSVAAAHLHAARLQIDSFVLEGKAMDRELSNHLDLYAQQQVRILKNLHEPFDIWLDILSEATKVSQNSMRTVFNEIKVKQEQIDHAERTAVKFVVGAFCGSASGLVDPVFNALKAVSDKVLSGSGPTPAMDQNMPGADKVNASEQLRAFAQWLLKSDIKADPISTMIKTLESNPPNTTLEWMKKYMDYKIKGPQVFADMFQSDSELWDIDDDKNPNPEKVNPKYIIKAMRRELTREYTLNTKDTHWEKHFAKQEYKKLYSKVKNELWKDFTSTIDSIFSAYSQQYVTAERLRDIVSYIKNKTFDDNKAGMASFDKANYEEVIKTLANELQLAGLLRYAMTYEPYWGGSPYPSAEHINAINDGTFSPDMNGKMGIARTWKTDFLNQAIYECYIQTQGDAARKLHNPFPDFDRLDDVRCQYFKTRYTPQQMARFDKIKGIVGEFFSCSVDERLIKSIESKLGKQNRVSITTQASPIPNPQAIDKIHQWKSAKSLYDESKHKLKRYIITYQTSKDALHAETECAKACIFSKIDLLRRTKVNIDIEAARNKRASPVTPSKLELDS